MQPHLTSLIAVISLVLSASPVDAGLTLPCPSALSASPVDAGLTLPCPSAMKCLPFQKTPTAQTTGNPGQICRFAYVLPLNRVPVANIYQQQGMYITISDAILGTALTLDITLQLRFLKVFVLVAWNAITPWHPTAAPTDFAPGFGLPFVKLLPIANETQAIYDRNVALGYAVHRVTQVLMPQAAANSADVLSHFSLDPTYDAYTNLTNPADIGNAAARALLKFYEHDGWNEDGTDRFSIPANGDLLRPQFGDALFPTNFSDWTGFVPANDAYTLRDIRRWQPLMETNGRGYFYAQAHITPQAGWARPWALTLDQVAKDFTIAKGPWPTVMDKAALAGYKDQSDQVIQASANLNEFWKVAAEHFDVKPFAFGANQYFKYVRLYGWDLTTALAYDMTIPTFLDATIVAWRNKIRHNSIRPVSSIRYLYGNRNITAYRGPGKGIGVMPGYKFSSYMRTMPHADFPSGTACLCSAFAEFNLHFIGTHVMNYTFDLGQGCSTREPGLTPQAYVNYTLMTNEDFMKVCPYTRLYAGVHYPKSIKAAVRLCKDVGRIGYQKAMNMLLGTAGRQYADKAWSA